MQQRATGWNQTHGYCSEDTASVNGAPALPTEQPSFDSNANVVRGRIVFSALNFDTSSSGEWQCQLSG